MKTMWKDIQKHLLSGVSFMMPVVVAGGVILAVSLLGATQTETGLVPNGPLLTYLNQLGKAGMAMMIPVFAAYISYSVAGKPGLTPGFILGYIANNAIMINGVEVKAGFLGALILGLLAGYMAKWMKGLKVGKTIRSIMPILVIPISTVLVLGLAYYFIIGYPISFLMQALSDLMVTLNGSGKAVLAVFMGFFSEIDFGGPVTKAVSMFTLSMINEGIMEPNGIFRILVAVPPIGIFLSTIIAKKKYMSTGSPLAYETYVSDFKFTFKDGQTFYFYWPMILNDDARYIATIVEKKVEYIEDPYNILYAMKQGINLNDYLIGR